MVYSVRKKLLIGIILPVIIAAVNGATKGFEIGQELDYDLITTMLFREATTVQPKNAGDVGFQITGKLQVAAIWVDPKDPDLLLLSIKVSIFYKINFLNSFTFRNAIF